jgi:hypothetical protein
MNEKKENVNDKKELLNEVLVNNYKIGFKNLSWSLKFAVIMGFIYALNLLLTLLLIGTGGN